MTHLELKRAIPCAYRLCTVVVVIVLLSVANSCRPAENDRSHLTGEPCLLPCWYEIVPGTSEATVAELASASHWTERPARIEDEQSILYHLYSHDVHASVLLLDDQATSIHLSGHMSTTMDEMVAVYGPPDFVVVLEGEYEYAIYSYHLDMGMLYWAFSPKEDHISDGQYEIYPRLTLEGIEVFPPTSSLEDSTEGGQYRFAYVQATPEKRREWQGYGYYLP